MVLLASVEFVDLESMVLLAGAEFVKFVCSSPSTVWVVFSVLEETMDTLCEMKKLKLSRITDETRKTYFSEHFMTLNKRQGAMTSKKATLSCIMMKVLELKVK